MAVQYGQYTFKTSNGSPSEWTLILREGANGTYIMENMFDVSDSPKLIGEFDAENMQMTFDGRVNGFGERQDWLGPAGQRLPRLPVQFAHGIHRE